jgi:opacity protein-like surface antigen
MQISIKNNNLMRGYAMMNKTKLALGIAAATLTMAGALVSPQAIAGSKADAEGMNSKVDALEAQLQAMQAEISRLRAESGRGADAGKVQELDEWMNSVKNKPVEAAEKNHLFSARGGWMHMDDNRGSTTGLAGSGLGADILTSETDKDAFYYGGAIDFNMNNDLFGLMPHTSFLMELGVEYSELGDRKDSGLDNVITAATGPGGVTGGVPTNLQQSVTVNMLRINASPKVKFMHGSKFRPWLIPVGLDINVISPPSDAVTVLNTGMQFGAGAEYELLKGIVIGADGRYHHTFDDVDGVNTDGFTLGGSLGFKF